MTTLRSLPTVLTIAAILTAISACGGTADGPSAVEVVPRTAEVPPRASLKFVASPYGATQWEVQDPSGGTIDTTGVYTAPEAEGTYTVVASTSSGDETTTIKVKRNVRVDASPSTATLAPGESLAFVARVTGNSKTVTWSVAEGEAGGTMTNAGMYTAPQTSGIYNIVATSDADPSKSDRSTVRVAEAPLPAAPSATVTIRVSPQTASVVSGDTVQFTATVNGSTDVGVTWSVAEPDGGTVSATGVYTAPATPGTYHVVATSNADPSQTSTASVTVTSPTVSLPVISSFTASPSSIAQGAMSTLVWTVSGDTSLSIDNGVGPVTGLSSTSVTPSASTTYTLTATNAAGSVVATVTVSVDAPAPTQTLPSGVVPAFPGAQGGGALSKGGRGGVVYEVTNLNNSGTGSLRACVQASGPRTCVFRVAGNIALTDALIVTNGNLTVAGQTAPGGGITLDGRALTAGAVVYIQANDVVWRYTKIRKGHNAGTPDQKGDSVRIYHSAQNVVLDHCSLSWTQDGNLDIESVDGYPAPKKITISWNMIYEPLAAHPTSGLTGGTLQDQMTDIDFHHNLYANASHRNPQLATQARFVNNIVYNWSYRSSHVVAGRSVDFVGNLYKRGSLTSTNGSQYAREILGNGTSGLSIYASGNDGPYMDGGPDNFAGIYDSGTNAPLSTSYKRTTPLTSTFTGYVQITAQSAATLESSVLPIVGASRRLDCNGSWVSNRDGADARVINEYNSGTQGEIPTTEADVGGFPTISSGTPCADADHDGMPDAWESANGSNPNDASDRNTVMSGGFTRLEHYLAGR